MQISWLSCSVALYRALRKGIGSASEGRGHRFESCRVRQFFPDLDGPARRRRPVTKNAPARLLDRAGARVLRSGRTRGRRDRFAVRGSIYR